jgi:hypothetical protein
LLQELLQFLKLVGRGLLPGQRARVWEQALLDHEPGQVQFHAGEVHPAQQVAQRPGSRSGIGPASPSPGMMVMGSALPLTGTPSVPDKGTSDRPVLEDHQP